MKQVYGWTTDTMKEGLLMLADTNGKPYLISQPVLGEGEPLHPTMHGAVLKYWPVPDGRNKLVVAMYPLGTIETYMFRLDDNGEGM